MFHQKHLWTFPKEWGTQRWTKVFMPWVPTSSKTLKHFANNFLWIPELYVSPEPLANFLIRCSDMDLVLSNGFFCNQAKPQSLCIKFVRNNHPPNENVEVRIWLPQIQLHGSWKKILLLKSFKVSQVLVLFMVDGILQERTKNLGYRREDFP